MSVWPIQETLDGLERARASESSLAQVFVSYSESGTALADRIGRELRASGVSVHLAKADSRGAVDFEETARNAIERSQLVVALATPSTLQSPWLFVELGMAHALEKRVLPVVSGGDWETLAKSIPQGLQSMRAYRLEDPHADLGELVRMIIKLLRDEAPAPRSKRREAKPVKRPHQAPPPKRGERKPTAKKAPSRPQPPKKKPAKKKRLAKRKK
jgi:hypothetical protein